MPLPDLPVYLFVVVPLIFIFISVFTNIRYEFTPMHYIGHSTIFASLVVGFIFLYAMQKYDAMDANVPVVVRNIVFLSDFALEYNPSLICYLVQYLEDFLTFTNNKFPILVFEEAILESLGDDEDTIFRVREAVTQLEIISHEKITGTNLIAPAIWYLVFIVSLLLTIIFPMDTNFRRAADSIIAILLIWLPIFAIYYLYTEELKRLEKEICEILDVLKEILNEEGVTCPENLTDAGRSNNNNKNNNNNNKIATRIRNRKIRRK